VHARPPDDVSCRGVKTRASERTPLVARTEIHIDATPEEVWSVLADAAAYGEWVVGTKNVSAADGEWPRTGSVLEYELGIGPVSVSDRTTVVEAEPPRKLVLRAELRRLGAAAIRLELDPVGDGTRVVMDEEPVEGVVDALHTRVTDAALRRRNDLALGRLKRLAEERP
jgi:uncharacterized protein YndB with AHSA1/START domain